MPPFFDDVSRRVAGVITVCQVSLNVLGQRLPVLLGESVFASIHDPLTPQGDIGFEFGGDAFGRTAIRGPARFLSTAAGGVEPRNEIRTFAPTGLQITNFTL